MSTRKQYIIYLVKGKTERHAEARARSKCKPFRVAAFQKDDFQPFLFWFCQAAGKYWVYPIGANEESEEWLIAQIGKDFSREYKVPDFSSLEA